jgi:hypothetical protein
MINFLKFFNYDKRLDFEATNCNSVYNQEIEKGISFMGDS